MSFIKSYPLSASMYRITSTKSYLDLSRTVGKITIEIVLD